MKIDVSQNPYELGEKAANCVADFIREAITASGQARIVLSTGASQFTTLEALVKMDIDWSKVEAFHLDEYIGLDENHPASFVKYLRERFVDKIRGLKAFHFVDMSGGAEKIIAKLTEEINAAPIDAGLIGIGENGHIAFNDPPAVFKEEASYKIVNLDEACRRQQMGEGWFKTLDDVPRQAVSMTVPQIMKCKHVISAVPYAVKADAICKTLTAGESTPMIPATILKTHPDFRLFADKDSVSKTDPGLLKSNQ
ncbi:MAG: glucosamine-6-phosphate deaminase [Treponema sp.]|jgi:glucosamine-6-phosphate deaminase|nr:glucosamine-6-phosphate deaminase [Treponema sp.]